MDNSWNFKIALKDETVFDKLARFYKTVIPDELKNFIVMANASNPDKNLISINGTERIFETVISFNEKETEAVSVFDLIEKEMTDSLIPFGIDPFGNLFYYSLITKKVVFYNHEEDAFEDSNYTLTDFISSLYK